MSDQKLHENAARLRTKFADIPYRNVRRAKLGRKTSAGISVDFSDLQPGYVIVRPGFNGDRAEVKAINAGINQLYADAPIKIGENEDGELCAFDADYNSETVGAYRGSLTAVAQPPTPAAADVAPKEASLIKGGRAVPDTTNSATLYVYIEPFQHNNLRLGDLHYDVGSGNVPGSANERRWVCITVDADNVGHTRTGTTSTIATTDAMRVSDAYAIDIPAGEIPCTFITLSYGQTDIRQSRLEDARDWIAPRGTLLSEASETLTISSGAVTAGYGSFLTLAAETGTSDTLDTLTFSGAPRIVLLQADSGDTITISDGADNIHLNGGADFVLSGDKTLAVFWDGANVADIGAGGSGGASPLTTKGDLYTYDTADARLPVGNDGDTLVVDSGEATGLKWIPGGVGSKVRSVRTLLYDDTLGSAGTWDVTSISQDYDDLYLEFIGNIDSASSGAALLRMYVNNDTTSGNYRYSRADFDSTYSGAQADGAFSGIVSNANSRTAPSVWEIRIPLYTGTTFYKQFQAQGNEDRSDTSFSGELFRMRWESTSAINRLTISGNGSDFVTGSRLRIWGVREEAIGSGTMEYSTDNVSNPPTDAELDTAFGTPAAVGVGFSGIVNDAGGGANEYLCWSDGANWFYATGTKAT